MNFLSVPLNSVPLFPILKAGVLSALILICGLVSDFSHANSDLIPGGDGRCNGPLERVPVVTSGGRPVATALTAYELAPLTPEISPNVRKQNHTKAVEIVGRLKAAISGGTMSLGELKNSIYAGSLESIDRTLANNTQRGLSSGSDSESASALLLLLQNNSQAITKDAEKLRNLAETAVDRAGGGRPNNLENVPGARGVVNATRTVRGWVSRLRNLPMISGLAGDSIAELARNIANDLGKSILATNNALVKLRGHLASEAKSLSEELELQDLYMQMVAELNDYIKSLDLSTPEGQALRRIISDDLIEGTLRTKILAAERVSTLLALQVQNYTVTIGSQERLAQLAEADLRLLPPIIITSAMGLQAAIEAQRSAAQLLTIRQSTNNMLKASAEANTRTKLAIETLRGTGDITAVAASIEKTYRQNPSRGQERSLAEELGELRAARNRALGTVVKDAQSLALPSTPQVPVPLEDSSNSAKRN